MTIFKQDPDYLYGMSNPNAKITDEIALEIFHSTKSCRELERIHHVSRTMISKIKRGLAWKHVTDKKHHKYKPV